MKNSILYRFKFTADDTGRVYNGIGFLRLESFIREWLAENAKGSKIMENGAWVIVDIPDEHAALLFKMSFG